MNYLLAMRTKSYLKIDETRQPFSDPTLYQSLVGSLLYLAVNARPDIAVSTAILGRKFKDPTEKDWTAAKRVLRYLKGTIAYKLCLGQSCDDKLVGYSDADWAGDQESRKSTSGNVFLFGGPISWTSRRQNCVSLSSMEAEYVALSEACQELAWLRRLLNDFGEIQHEATLINVDNQSCISFVNTERLSRRSKHIETRERYVRELCNKNEVHLQYCPTDSMLADIFTKPLGPVKQLGFCKELNLV